MGLSHSLEYLESLWPEIIFYELKEQAKCADTVTKQNITNNQWNADQSSSADEISGWSDEFIRQHINATSVGNAAYCALHSKDKAAYDALILRLKQVYVVTADRADELFRIGRVRDF
jgi:hypothetical protein